MGRRFKDQRLYDRDGSRFIWARVTNAAGKIERHSTRLTDPEAASRWADEWERKAADPSYRRAAEATLDDAIGDWLAQLERRRVSEATYSIAECKAGHFVRLWGGDWPLLRVDNDLVLRFIDTRESEGVRPLTVKKELGALKGILEWARFRGRFPHDIATVIPPGYSGQHKPRQRAPTPSEVTALVLDLEPKRGAHVAFIAATGARRQESFRAQRADVDWTNLIVRIRGSKTERSSDPIPITGLTRDLIVFALQHAPGKTVLFEPWGNLSRDLHAACVRVGIEPVTPNDLRRAFGTWHRKAGATAEQVSMLLRHTTDTLAQTTYGRISGADIGPALRALLPVSNLDAPTASTETNGPDTEGPSMQTIEPPSRVELETYGLRNLSSKDAITRLSRGTIVGKARAAKAHIVSLLDFRARAKRWLSKPLPPAPPESDDDIMAPLRRVRLP